MKCKTFCLVKEFIKKNSKIVSASIIVNIAWIIVMIAVNSHQIDRMDFGIYYTISADWAKNGFTNTYNEAYWHSQELMPWRYFPFFLMIFSALTTLPIEIAYTIWMIIEMSSVIACVAYMWKMMEMMECSPKKGNVLIMAFLMIFIPMDCVNMGNVGIIIGCIGMLSLYCFIVKKESIGCLLIGLSIMIKPVLLVVAVLIIISLGKKGFIKRVIFIFAFLVPDMIIFLTYPGVMHSFISMNFTGDKFYGCFRLGSLSFMNIVAMLTDSTFFPQMIALCGCVIYGLVLSSKMKTQDEKLLSIFAIGSFAYLIIFPDVWTSQLMFILPFWLMFIQKEWNGNKHMYLNFASYVMLLYAKGALMNAFYFFGMLQDFSSWSWNLVYTMPVPFLFIVVMGIVISVLGMIEFSTFAFSSLKIFNLKIVTIDQGQN